MTAKQAKEACRAHHLLMRSRTAALCHTINGKEGDVGMSSYPAFRVKPALRPHLILQLQTHRRIAPGNCELVQGEREKVETGAGQGESLLEGSGMRQGSF